MSSSSSSSYSPMKGMAQSQPSVLSPPLIKKRLVESQDDANYGSYLFIPEVDELIAKVVQGKEVSLLSFKGYTYRGDALKFEAWGTNAVETHKHLKACLEIKKCKIFTFKSCARINPRSVQSR